MNPSILQYKNYWKWGHTIYACCSSHLIIQDLEGASWQSKTKWFVLSENMEDGAEQSLALAYILCLYESNWSHILNWGLRTWKSRRLLEDSKVCCH